MDSEGGENQEIVEFWKPRKKVFQGRESDQVCQPLISKEAVGQELPTGSGPVVAVSDLDESRLG